MVVADETGQLHITAFDKHANEIEMKIAGRNLPINLKISGILEVKPPQDIYGPCLVLSEQ